ENKANMQVYDEMGLVYAKLGKFKDADVCWKRVIASDPHFAPTLFNLGQLAMEQGKADEARNWLDQALQQEPSNLKFRYFAGLNLKQAGMEPEAKAVWESAKAYLTAADPYAARIAAALGRPLPAPLPPVKTGAETLVTTPPSVAVQPTSIGGVVLPPASGSETSDPAYIAALDSARAGRYQEAISGFNQVLARYPGGFNSRMNLGNVYKAMNQPGDAAAQYLLALRQERNNQNALTALARAYDDLGLRGHAAGLTARASGKEDAAPAATERSNPRAFEPVTRALLANGLAEEALSIINNGVAENPDSPELALLQGDVLLAVRQDGQAEAAYKRALDIDKQSPAPLIKLGDLFVARQQNDSAIAQYQAALKSPMIDPDSMFSIVDRFNRLGRRTEATEILSRLKGINLSESQLTKLRERTGASQVSAE
ncbi:MAG TPA: tetratricopeptide repeat protein, partial [Candidatus Ozemobacteraceae bacterium]|nr:tetratricopeptide repeat protein [Candidatus Ozemobacteraceae bacterium]